tara:strand:+ start:14738 stop:15565 length:828 start_codon:yes stop_codon:yes gene_type:complete
MSNTNNLDINDEGALEAGHCLDEFIRQVNSHITGACMIPMKLPKKEVIQIVKRAKEWFYKKYEDSVQENYYVIDKANFETAQYQKSKVIELPSARTDGSGRIFSVNNLAVAGDQMAGISSKNGFTDSDFSMERLMLGGSSQGTFSSSNGENLMYYVITEKYFDLARHVLINKISFNYNRLTRNLKILGEKPKNHVILETFETIPDCALYEDEIFFRYVAAHVKKAIGTMVMMFGYNMPGNITLNGDMIRDDAQTELDAIEEEIKGDEGVDWFMTS